MDSYDNEVIPSEIARRERDYPDYAISLPRMRIKSSRILARAEAMGHNTRPIDRALASQVLTRLHIEGPQPVYDEMVKASGVDPVRDMEFRQYVLVKHLSFAYRWGRASRRPAYAPKTA
jgi:hypothetical protein